jgi:membrane metallo-endopeptidase-like protein 1
MPYERLKKGLNDTAVQASLDYMIQLAVLFGADKNTAASDMKDVIEFEISLAKVIRKGGLRALRLDFR